MKIYIGADHQGFALKVGLIEFIRHLGHEVIDKGDGRLNPEDDFPQFAARVVSALLADNQSDGRGILICGSGQGMAMAANRFNDIRASLVWDLYEAKAARNDDNSNVLCLPARVLKEKSAMSIINAWLTTPFAAAPRFIRRLQQLDELN